MAEEKGRGYLWIFGHPAGGPKAAWFAAIGYHEDNRQDLGDDFLLLARSEDDFVAKPSPFGVKYERMGRIGLAVGRPSDVMTRLDRRREQLATINYRVPWVMAMLAEHSIVVLHSDMPDAGLHSGEVGAIVFVHGQGRAYEVECVDAEGAIIALLTLHAGEVRPIPPGELLHVRRRDLAEAADDRESEYSGWLASLGTVNAQPR